MSSQAIGWLRSSVLAGAMALTVVTVVACGSDPTPTATPTPQADDPTAEAKADWEVRLDETIAKAKEEPPLVWNVNSTVAYALEPLLAEFTRKYGVAISFDTAPGGQTVDRTLAAREGGVYEMNLFSTSAGGSGRRMINAGAFQPIAPLLFFPDVVDTSLWWQDEHWYADDQGEFMFSFSVQAKPSSQLILINTDLVTQAEVDAVQSDFDWLDQKWAGKMVALDPTGSITVNGYADAYRFPWLGESYIRQLFSDELDVTFVRDLNLAVDGILSEKWSLGIMLGGLGDASLQELIKNGAPLEVVQKPLPGTPMLMSSDTPPNTIALADRAPSHNAAVLFLNWFLSKEGQTFYQEHAAAPVDPSLRTDVTANTMVDPTSVIDPNIDYVFYTKDPAYSAATRETADAAVQQIFRETR